MRFTVVLILSAGLLLFGCKSSSKTEQKTDGANSTPATAAVGDTVTTASGLKYIEIKTGDGATPQDGQRVSVHYTVWLTSGRKIDSSRDRGQPWQFSLHRPGVIKGMDEAVSTMRIGGQRKLIVPPELAYGDRGQGGQVPPGATLIFEVELVDVK